MCHVKKISLIGVVGAGTMGHGIAETVALAGYTVRLEDAYPQALDKAKVAIRASLDRLVSSGRIDKSKADEAYSRISYHTTLEEALKGVDLVIEAVPEDVDLKRGLFAKLAQLTPKGVILASNTSNIRITTIASGTGREEDIVGIHFFNPPVIMKAVEVIRGGKTSDNVFEDAVNFVVSLGKTPIKVLKDTPGFVINRITAPEGLLFCLLLERGISTAQVDAYFKRQGLPMGPYELMDYVGVDVAAHSLKYYGEELSPDYKKCSALDAMVKGGRLGLKSGRGFYEWRDNKAVIPQENPSSPVDLMDVLCLEVNEAVKLIEEGVAKPEDIEEGVKLGLNRPFGPITAANSISQEELKSRLEKLSSTFGVEVFKPTTTILEGKLKQLIAPPQQPTKPSRGEQYITTDRPAPKVARIILENTKNNLINVEVLNQLEEAIHSLWNDKEIVVILITGKGENLSAGAQLNQFFQSGIEFAEMSRRGQRVFRLLSEVPKVTIALMKGYVLGGGFELSLACDMRLATEQAQIGFPELTLGLIPGWGGTQRLSRLIGLSRAAHMVLTAERISGRQAYDWGLVSKLVSKERVDDEAVAYASELAGRIAPLAAGLAKRLLNKGSEIPMDNSLEWEATAMGALYGTEDLREGISAFLQKRKAEFKAK
ncbi:MAG: 3-hydroxyacyl-CoA dehydrogenase NAD-binding domain-containing protein [Thermoprotei archaeon]